MHDTSEEHRLLLEDLIILARLEKLAHESPSARARSRTLAQVRKKHEKVTRALYVLCPQCMDER